MATMMESVSPAVSNWLEQLNRLIGTVRDTAQESGWITEKIDGEKILSEGADGSYAVPLLYLQRYAKRLLLEPITRLAPACEGVVDLSTMPLGDEVASFFLIGGGWKVYLRGVRKTKSDNSRSSDSLPLDGATLTQILSEVAGRAS